jgi:5-dehydro-2-deoxygluconokinase
VALKYANACGAFAVSRHGCTPAYPSLEELTWFLDRGVRTPALRKDPDLEQIHWSTNRHGVWDRMRVFAFDHRKQLEEMEGATPERIGQFKLLCLQAAQQVAAEATATASSATTASAATRSTAPPAPASGSAVPWNGPAPAP